MRFSGIASAVPGLPHFDLIRRWLKTAYPARSSPITIAVRTANLCRRYRRHKFAVLTAIVIGLLLAGYAVFNQRLIRSKWGSPGTALAIPEKRIAVLPFEKLSADKQNTYFADGVQDEILT